MTAAPARFDSARCAANIDAATIALAQLSVAIHHSKAAQYGAVTAAALCLPRQDRRSDDEYVRQATRLAERWEDPQRHLFDLLLARLHVRARTIMPA